MNATRYDYDPENITGLSHAGDRITEPGRYVTEADYEREVGELQAQIDRLRRSDVEPHHFD